MALVVAFIYFTGGGTDDAFGFGIVLFVAPGAIVAGQLWGERLLVRASGRLGFDIRRVSSGKGERPAPAFETEEGEADWHFTLLEGTRDGRNVALYDYTASNRGIGRGKPRRALGAIWALPSGGLPTLVVHGPTRLRVHVRSSDAFGRPVDALSSLPPVVPGSPLPDFEKHFSAFGRAGAEVLLTEAVQKALVDLPHRSRLLVEGSRVRWEMERGDPLSRGLGRRAEELLRTTAPLRDALLEAAPLVLQ